MKSKIYEFDPVIYHFRLLVSKDFDPCAYLEQWISNCIERTLKGHPEHMNGKMLSLEE